MGTTRLPPIFVLRTTEPLWSFVTRPILRASLPRGCERRASTALSSPPEATNERNLPSFAIYSGSRPRISQAPLTGSGTGILSSQISMPTFAALAISLSTDDNPPRVASLRQCTSAPDLRTFSTGPHRGAESLSTFVSRLSPSLATITAIPWRPIAPFRIILSPDLTALGDIPSYSTVPTPVVLMNIPSALPFSTTLVSPVTTITSASLQALEIDLTILAKSAIRNPSSIMKERLSISGLAPHIARSFTVPCTDRLPMSPPGKNMGFTTKESVVNASLELPSSKTAPSWSSSRYLFLSAGTNSLLTNSAEGMPPLPWARVILTSVEKGVGHKGLNSAKVS